MIFSSSSTQPNTPYVIKNTLTEVLQELETVSKNLFKWLIENEMMVNADKYHLLFSSVKNHTIEINGSTVKNLHREKLLGMHFDDQLKSDFHIEKLYKNANRKLHVNHVTCYMSMSVTSYMDLSKKRILMNTFFDSQFNYCPLI